MYKILYKGDILAYCEEPNYVKIADNGCYNSCSRNEASGIAVHSIVYPLDQVVVLHVLPLISKASTGLPHQVAW